MNIWIKLFIDTLFVKLTIFPKKKKKKGSVFLQDYNYGNWGIREFQLIQLIKCFIIK